MKRASILRQIEEVQRELEDHKDQVAQCESYIAELEANLRSNEEPEKIARVAAEIEARHRPSGYEGKILLLAAEGEFLDSDQHSRLSLLAREYDIPL